MTDATDAYVVDTNIVSYIFRGNPQAQPYEKRLAGKLMLISFMTLAEIRLWMLHSGWGALRAARMEGHVKEFVMQSCNSDLCRIWAEVTHSERAKGRVIGTSDAWIAATAIQNGVPLVTHNHKHFEGIDNLTVISESN